MEQKTQRKMKNWVMVRPRKPKEWIVLVLIIANILLAVSPIVNLFNVNAMIFGIPVLFAVAVGSLILTIIIINIAYRWGVH